jgi:hypothetical protein
MGKPSNNPEHISACNIFCDLPSCLPPLKNRVTIASLAPKIRVARVASNKLSISRIIVVDNVKYPTPDWLVHSAISTACRGGHAVLVCKHYAATTLSRSFRQKHQSLVQTSPRINAFIHASSKSLPVTEEITVRDIRLLASTRSWTMWGRLGIFLGPCS